MEIGAIVWATVWRFCQGWLNGHRREHILRYMYQVGIAEPYPTKAIHPPIYPGEADWRSYYRSRNLNIPHQYHNGWHLANGGWFSCGGFGQAMVGKMRRNVYWFRWQGLTGRGADGRWEFNEWLHGESGHPMGYAQQAWSAAMYLYAEQAVQTGELPLFGALVRGETGNGRCRRKQ